jgi:long-chain acyl-CoA synthetase
LRVVTGCFVIEGYGATETCGAASLTLPGETSVGHIGPPLLCALYKLADVPEMDLVASRDNKGEVLVAGTNVFNGYFKDEEKTKAALTEDGWFRTGDIGSYDENGCIKIVDRVKNIFKLQQGEYIAPEKIENLFVKSKYVSQVFIYGSSYKSNLVGIVVPEESVLFEWAQANNVSKDLKSLCRNETLKKLILDDLIATGKASELKGFELVILKLILFILKLKIKN